MKTTYGYSLIETMVSLSIVAVLISYALPSFYQLKSDKFLAHERDRLMVSFAFARTHAITEQTHVVVCPSLSGTDCDNLSNWNQGWIIFSDNNNNRQLDNGETLLQFENPMDDSIKATSSASRTKIQFNNVGFAPGSNVSINFCDQRGAEFALSLIINNAGRIKQSKPIAGNICT